MLPNKASTENRSTVVRMSARGAFGIRCGWEATGRKMGAFASGFDRESGREC
jgi:hypothetical protein